MLVRTFFAEVEGVIYTMRGVILWAHERAELQLSAAEEVLLREEAYFVDLKRKKIRVRGSFNRTLESFWLVFEVLPRIVRPEFTIDYSDSGWEKFQKLLGVRNDITHPKNTGDFMLKVEVLEEILPQA